MGLEYSVGTEGPTITIDTPEDLWSALDNLHTQVLDNIPEGPRQLAYLRILEKAMEDLQALGVSPSF